MIRTVICLRVGDGLAINIHTILIMGSALRFFTLKYRLVLIIEHEFVPWYM